MTPTYRATPKGGQVIAVTTRERRTFLVQVCSGFRLACSSSVAGSPSTSNGGATMSSSRCCTM